MACCCCRSWCLVSIAIAFVAICYFGCSFRSTLETLSCFPVIGPFLIDNGLVVTKDSPLNFLARLPKRAAVDQNIPTFTKEELFEYRGGEKGLYLAALGLVYDVKKAEKHYGPGNKYHPLAGRDASRAFLTADYTDAGLRDDVIDLFPDELIKLQKWVENYPNDFPLVGKLIGRYYDENGEPTEDNKKLQVVFRNAPSLMQYEEDLKKTFPGCNSRFLSDEGGKFWCTKNSAGIEREIPGFPRKLTIKETGRKRCACASKDQLNDPRLSEYPDCAKDSEECQLKVAVHHDEL